VSFSLYIHIPWCQAKCPYCDFNSYAAAAWPEAEYTRAIVAEMRSRAADAPFLGAPLRTIFFGGGTPSLFAPDSIAAIIDAASATFGIEPGAEITLEANPGTVDYDKLAGMRTAGVNRLSMGAQSFDDDVLKYLGRIHRAGDTRAAARAAHRAGFERMNLDLIFAVPGQTLAGVMRDIGEAAALQPDHISAYNLTFEEGTAFFAEMKRGRIVPLEGDEQAAMYAAVREEVARRGYPMYEISNYARPGCEARHNLTYWRAQSYLGLGAGAHSFALGSGAGYGRRWWNERAPARYLEMVSHGGRAESGAEEIDAAIGASEFVFLNLRLREGFCLDDFRARFGREFDEVFGPRAARMAGLSLRGVRVGRRGGSYHEHRRSLRAAPMSV
jgi:putative oxygen-independent coproporphyrinogen III oxidase